MTDVKTPQEILGLWADLRLDLETLDHDLYKSLIKANTAAGRRARAKFRQMRKEMADIVREMVKLDKERAARKKLVKQEKKAEK